MPILALARGRMERGQSSRVNRIDVLPENIVDRVLPLHPCCAPVTATNPTLAVTPIAIVRGTPLIEVPRDLYIPPDALEVLLETFTGPLDLLLYLIRRQNLDILDIPIADIARQYMEYVELMTAARLELAAEYLVMAAILCEIKSRLLLPRASAPDEETEDPRAALIRRLLEYERFKQAALDLDALPRLERDHFLVRAAMPPILRPRAHPDLDLPELLGSLRELLTRAAWSAAHRIEQEELSLRERMTRILEQLPTGDYLLFVELLDRDERRAGVVITFLALLELARDAVLELVQMQPFGPIRVRRRETAT